jgi:hypothetical protein
MTWWEKSVRDWPSASVNPRAVERCRETVWASPQDVLMVAANAAEVSTVGNGC